MRIQTVRLDRGLIFLGVLLLALAGAIVVTTGSSDDGPEIIPKSSIPGWMRALVVGGGTLAYLIVLIAMMLVSGTI